MASWFSGFGSFAAETPSCTEPSDGRPLVEVVPDIGLKPGLSSPAQDDAPAPRRPASWQRSGHHEEEFDSHQMDANLPSDFRAALKRTNAMIQAQLTAQESAVEKRFSEMQDVLSAQAAEIKGLKAGAQLGQSDETRHATMTADAGSSMPDGTMSSLRDDVQTIVDAMRIELGKHKTLLNNLNEQVQQIGNRPELRDETSALSALSFESSGLDKQGTARSYVSQRRFEEMQAELKDEIRALGASFHEAEANFQKARQAEASSQKALITRQVFERFTDEIGHKMEDIGHKLVEIKNDQELAAVKAGFLAVAATECSHEEKDHMFKTLKQQEEQCQRNVGRESLRITAQRVSMQTT